MNCVMYHGPLVPIFYPSHRFNEGPVHEGGCVYLMASLRVGVQQPGAHLGIVGMSCELANRIRWHNRQTAAGHDVPSQCLTPTCYVLIAYVLGFDGGSRSALRAFESMWQDQIEEENLWHNEPLSVDEIADIGEGIVERHLYTYHSQMGGLQLEFRRCGGFRPRSDACLPPTAGNLAEKFFTHNCSIWCQKSKSQSG